MASLYSVLLVRAPPPQLSELGDTREVLAVLHVPTDLQLGLEPGIRHASTYPQPGTFVHAETSPFKKYRPNPGTDASVISRVQQPLQHMQESSSSRIGQLATHALLSQHAEAHGHVRFTSVLDRSLENTLMDPEFNNYLRIPMTIEYVHSSWFDTVFEDFRDSYGNLKWTRPSKDELSDEDLNKILRRKELFHGGKSVYRLGIVSQAWTKVEPGEVLVMPHRQLSLPTQTMIDVSSVWSTKDNGRILAFLGLYNIPEMGRRKLLQETVAAEYVVIPWSEKHMNAYLMPRTQDH